MMAAEGDGADANGAAGTAAPSAKYSAGTSLSSPRKAGARVTWQQKAGLGASWHAMLKHKTATNLLNPMMMQDGEDAMMMQDAEGERHASDAEAMSPSAALVKAARSAAAKSRAGGKGGGGGGGPSSPPRPRVDPDVSKRLARLEENVSAILELLQAKQGARVASSAEAPHTGVSSQSMGVSPRGKGRGLPALEPLLPASTLPALTTSTGPPTWE